LRIITAKEITKVLGIDCCSHVLRSVQSMIQFIAVNDLVVCLMTTIVKQLESKDSVFCTIRGILRELAPQTWACAASNAHTQAAWFTMQYSKFLFLNKASQV